MRKFISVICFALMTSCCSKYNNDMDFVAARQREKLKAHFSQGIKKSRCGTDVRSYDLHSLIYETRYIAGRLRAQGRMKEANEFDSYVDVLMFGNKTIDESIDDVVKLVNGGVKTRSMYQKFIGFFCD